MCKTQLDTDDEDSSAFVKVVQLSHTTTRLETMFWDGESSRGCFFLLALSV